MLLFIMILGILTRTIPGKFVPPKTATITPEVHRYESAAQQPAPRPAVKEPVIPPVAKPSEPPEILPVQPQQNVKPAEITRVAEEAAPAPKPVEAPKMAARYTEITVKLTKGDFTLTPAAVEKLTASSQSSAGGEPRILRIARLPGMPVQLRMFVDKQGQNDISVLNNDLKILFLSPEAAELLGGIVIDYQASGTGGEFALSKKKTV